MTMLDSPYKLLEPVEVSRYLDRGYRIIDPHLHTSASHDVIPSDRVSPVRLLDYMLDNGWGFVTFTDHDTLAAYRQLPKRTERLVRGVEIKIKPRRIGQHTRTHTLHVNVYMLSDVQCETLETIAATGDFYAFIDYLKGERLRYALNHPFWHEAFEVPNWEIVADIFRGGYFPLTEYNWGRIPEQNAKVLDVASQFGLPVWGASDDHVGNPQYATLVQGDTFEEVWEHVIAGNARLVRQHRRALGGQMLTIRDHEGYAGYVVDTIMRGGEQLLEVKSAELRNKPVTLDSGSAWRNLLVRFVTNGVIGQVCPLTSMFGKLTRRHGDWIAPLLAKPYVKSQMNDLDAIERLVADLTPDVVQDFTVPDAI
jgi:predicted metal-dependent phosphoesterase TrpH